MGLLEKLDDEQFVRVVQEDNMLLIWSLIDGTHYFSSRYFSMRLNAKEVEEYAPSWEFLNFLAAMFGKEPQEGQTLKFQNGDVMEIGPKIAAAVIKRHNEKPSKVGKVTPYLYAHKIFRYRWTKFDTFNLFVQDKFISLVHDAVNEPIYSVGPDSTAYLCDGDLFILPIRNGDKQEEVKGLGEFESLIKSLELLEEGTTNESI